MACFKTTAGRIIPEKTRWVKLPGEEIIPGSVDWHCGERLPEDPNDKIFTSNGFMVGNLVKKVATSMGFKHCFKCSKRQRRYNEAGLRVQRKLGLVK